MYKDGEGRTPPMQYQYDVDLKSVGSYIKIARESTGLNQAKFAEKWVLM